jgi:hypothetical protein
LRSGGGGGFGSPLERPPAEVQADVRQGYVTLASARDYYGVVLDPETLAVDVAATDTMRAKLAPVLRTRVASQTAPVRRLSAVELSEKPPEHTPVPCLRISCCGIASFAFDEDELRS